MSILTAFTTQVINFATELTNMYPNDSFFKSALTAASLMKKTNPRLMYNLTMEHISSYKEQIFTEDDTFFVDQIAKLEEEKKTEESCESSNDECESSDDECELKRATNAPKLVQDEENFNFILRVRTYWIEMSPNTKKQIWMYLKVLFKLSDRLN
jgi:hypothetical protein